MSSDRTNRIIATGSPEHSLSGSAASAEPIDPEALAELRSHFDGQESVSFDDLLGLFLGELDPRLRAIRNAIEHGDAKGIAAAAHVLKGSSMLVGARAMADLCLELELASRSGAIAQARVVLTLLEDEAARVRQALTAALKTGSGR